MPLGLGDLAGNVRAVADSDKDGTILLIPRGKCLEEPPADDDRDFVRAVGDAGDIFCATCGEYIDGEMHFVIFAAKYWFPPSRVSSTVPFFCVGEIAPPFPRTIICNFLGTGKSN